MSAAEVGEAGLERAVHRLTGREQRVEIVCRSVGELPESGVDDDVSGLRWHGRTCGGFHRTSALRRRVRPWLGRRGGRGGDLRVHVSLDPDVVVLPGATEAGPAADGDELPPPPSPWVLDVAFLAGAPVAGAFFAGAFRGARDEPEDADALAGPPEPDPPAVDGAERRGADVCPVAFFAVAFVGVAFLAVVFLAVVFLAVVFLAVVFLAVVFFVAAFVAVEVFAVDFAGDRVAAR